MNICNIVLFSYQFAGLELFWGVSFTRNRNQDNKKSQKLKTKNCSKIRPVYQRNKKGPAPVIGFFIIIFCSPRSSTVGIRSYLSEHFVKSKSISRTWFKQHFSNIPCTEKKKFNSNSKNKNRKKIKDFFRGKTYFLKYYFSNSNL